MPHIEDVGLMPLRCVGKWRGYETGGYSFCRRPAKYVRIRKNWVFPYWMAQAVKEKGWPVPLRVEFVCGVHAPRRWWDRYTLEEFAQRH